MITIRSQRSAFFARVAVRTAISLAASPAAPPPRVEVTAPDGAPNVLIVLIDDMGFGMPSGFGGPIHMPTVERLADGALRHNQFHTTAVCSPTRTALLSGRNHHMNNMGGTTETATAFPGHTGQRPNNVAPLAEMLRLNGYSTGFFGKNHETAPWEVSPSGPTDRWPTRSGFDEFCGFFGGWSLYMKAGKPVYVYNFIGLERSTVASPQALPAGKSTVRLEFAYDGGGLGKGGLATILVNDRKVAEGQIERTQRMIFSADETADVGEGDATPVMEDYKAYDNKFTGRILKVTVDVKEMGAGVKAEATAAGAGAAKKREGAK
jgi:hypothetical protein